MTEKEKQRIKSICEELRLAVEIPNKRTWNDAVDELHKRIQKRLDLTFKEDKRMDG